MSYWIVIFAMQIIEEANNALKWLQEKSSAQSKLKRTDAPLLLSTDIKKKQDVLARVSEPILSKPAPAPKVHLIYPNLHISFCICLLKETLIKSRLKNTRVMKGLIQPILLICN